MTGSTSDYFFALERGTEQKLNGLRREIRDSVNLANQNLEKLRRLAPLTGNIKRDRKVLDAMHDLGLQEARIEEKALVAALEVARIKQKIFIKQQKDGEKKVPDFRTEGIFLQMKEDRMEQTLRSINQELDEWLRKLRAPF